VRKDSESAAREVTLLLYTLFECRLLIGVGCIRLWRLWRFCLVTLGQRVVAAQTLGLIRQAATVDNGTGGSAAATGAINSNITTI